MLENGNLAWYGQPKKHESGATPNGTLVIEDCNVSSVGQFDEGYAFAIYSRKDKGSEYILMASSANEMEDWVLILLKCGAVIEKERKGTTAEFDVEALPTGGGSLRGKVIYYFV